MLKVHSGVITSYIYFSSFLENTMYFLLSLEYVLAKVSPHTDMQFLFIRFLLKETDFVNFCYFLWFSNWFFIFFILVHLMM